MVTFEITINNDIYDKLIEQVKKIRLIDDYHITRCEFIEDSISSSCSLLDLQRSNHSGVSAYAEKGACNIYE